MKFSFDMTNCYAPCLKIYKNCS